MSSSEGHRRGSDPTLLWLWCRLAAVAAIRLLIWGLPYAVGMALKKQNKTKQKTERKGKSHSPMPVGMDGCEYRQNLRIWLPTKYKT